MSFKTAFLDIHGLNTSVTHDGYVIMSECAGTRGTNQSIQADDRQ
jgi:hypothetical protein